MKINNQLIGMRIQRLRKAHGLTQEQLSEMIDRAPNYISQLERGLKSMSLETLISLSNILDASPEDILMDCLTGSEKAIDRSYSKLLSDCTLYEKHILLEILEASKKAIQKQRAVSARSSHGLY